MRCSCLNIGNRFSDSVYPYTNSPFTKGMDHDNDPGRLPEEIKFVKHSNIQWLPDSSGFFYQVWFQIICTVGNTDTNRSVSLNLNLEPLAWREFPRRVTMTQWSVFIVLAHSNVRLLEMYVASPSYWSWQHRTSSCIKTMDTAVTITPCRCLKMKNISSWQRGKNPDR